MESEVIIEKGGVMKRYKDLPDFEIGLIRVVSDECGVGANKINYIEYFGARVVYLYDDNGCVAKVYLDVDDDVERIICCRR